MIVELKGSFTPGLFFQGFARQGVTLRHSLEVRASTGMSDHGWGGLRLPPATEGRRETPLR